MLIYRYLLIAYLKPMKSFFLLLLFSFSLSWGQTKTYTSPLTEYRYDNKDLKASYQWTQRNVTVSRDTIMITNLGNKEIEVNRWKINRFDVTQKDEGSITTFYTQLINSPENTVIPAIFRIIKAADDHVEVIEWEFPYRQKALVARFHVDITY